jgi:four helix bundle protein
MKDNVVVNKSFMFSVSIVKMYQSLVAEKREFVLSRQVVRSGTSIGANVEEAIGGISEKDFMAKMSIAYKEARETKYWLRLLRETSYITEDQFNPIADECNQLLKILYSIINTTKNK